MVTAAIILVSVLATATLSGIFGMGGGMVLMGVLALTLPLRAAMIAHGVIQLGANSYRALLFRRSIRWRIVGSVAGGATAALATLVWLQFELDLSSVFIVLGTLPLVTIALPKRVRLTVESWPQALLCGYLFSALQLVAGASGPILDAFFLRGRLTRFEIVATKATIGSLGHIFKLLYWGFLLRSAMAETIPWPLIVIAVPLAFTGTRLGKRVLARLSERNFQRFSRLLIAVIATVYLSRGLLG